jgi:hypothetical protein
MVVRWTLKEYRKPSPSPHTKDLTFKINPTLILTLMVVVVLLNLFSLMEEKKIVKPNYRYYSDPNIYLEVK